MKLKTIYFCSAPQIGFAILAFSAVSPGTTGVSSKMCCTTSDISFASSKPTQFTYPIHSSLPALRATARIASMSNSSWFLRLVNTSHSSFVTASEQSANGLMRSRCSSSRCLVNLSPTPYACGPSANTTRQGLVYVLKNSGKIAAIFAPRSPLHNRPPQILAAIPCSPWPLCPRAVDTNLLPDDVIFKMLLCFRQLANTGWLPSRDKPFHR